jgi:hypothetical protein
MQGGESVALHEDAFGLPEHVPVDQRGVEVVFAGGPGESDRGVLGDQLRQDFRVRGEDVGLGGVEVERAQGRRAEPPDSCRYPFLVFLSMNFAVLGLVGLTASGLE